MLDKNGIEIKTGDVVEITGAYFKNDNGFYYVEHSAGILDGQGAITPLERFLNAAKSAKQNIIFVSGLSVYRQTALK